MAIVKNCPACHTDINPDGSISHMIAGDAFTCKTCGGKWALRADLGWDALGDIKGTNDPRTDDGKAAASKLRSAKQ